MPRIDRNPPIDAVHQVDEIRVPRIDHPVDARVLEPGTQRRRKRDGVDDVAERPEADDEEAVQDPERAMRARRSRVE